MNINIPGPAIGGEYRFTVLRADRTVKFRSKWVKNLITDIGMDRIGSGSSLGNICRIGTGTTAPANSDTQLVAQVASTSTLAVGPAFANAGTPNYESTGSWTYEFAIGAVVGNMAEVGIGWSTTGATLFSRALILDGGGSPTTITVLVTEILQVTYRFTMYPVLTDSTGSVTISGTSYSYTARVAMASSVLLCYLTTGTLLGAMFVTAYNGSLGAITASPAGSSTTLANGTFLAYTNGTYYRDYTFSASISQGNLAGGIKSIKVELGSTAGGNTFRTQIEFGTAIPKTSSNQLSLTFRQPWSRH